MRRSAENDRSAVANESGGLSPVLEVGDLSPCPSLSDAYDDNHNEDFVTSQLRNYLKPLTYMTLFDFMKEAHFCNKL